MSDIFDLFKKIQSKPAAAPAGPGEWLIVGLGNPGAKYDGTRHNVGFAALDQLASQLGIRVDQLKFKALCGDAVIDGKRVLLMKPSTFMNLSGQAVQEAAHFYKIPTDHILVFSDDISLPVGKLRIRRKGSAGGHNGIKNIIANLGTDRFQRIKIGVGEKPKEWDLADYVLSPFSREERAKVDKAISHAAKALELMLSDETDAAMNEYNRKVER